MANEVRRPDGVGVHQLVLCVDGPAIGSCYFESYGSASWEDQLRIARADPAPGSWILGYEPTGAMVPHPRWPDVKCKALSWRRREVGGGPDA